MNVDKLTENHIFVLKIILEYFIEYLFYVPKTNATFFPSGLFTLVYVWMSVTKVDRLGSQRCVNESSQKFGY